MKLHKTLQALCKEKELTLSRVSRLSGVPVQTIHSWTVGRSSVNPDQVKAVAQVLEVSVHYLLFGETDRHEPPTEEILKELFSGDVRVTLHKIERKRK
jgi:transcriptional regulator with XRE-family HTH domain